MALAPYSLEVTRRLIAVDEAMAKGGQLTTAFRKAQDGQPERLDLIVGSSVTSFTREAADAIVFRLTQDGFTSLAEKIGEFLPVIEEPPAPTVDQVAEVIRQAIDFGGDHDVWIEALDKVRDEIGLAAVRAQPVTRGQIAYDV